MKKMLFPILTSLLFFTMHAQSLEQKQRLLKNIEHRDTIMDKVGKKVLPDSLKAQIADYKQLTIILRDEVGNYSTENQKLKKDLNKFLVLTTADTLIFHQNFNDFDDIPVCLNDRANIVTSIIELRTKIVAAETTAKELEITLGNSPIAYAAIREKIESALNEIQILIHKIKEMNLSSLSDEQQKYFRPGLTDRYNNFKKYF